MFLVSLIESSIWNFKESKVDQEMRDLVVANVNFLGWSFVLWFSAPLCQVVFQCYSGYSPTCLPKINLNFYFMYSLFWILWWPVLFSNEHVIYCLLKMEVVDIQVIIITLSGIVAHFAG